jgi:hypothetical protein
MVKQIFLKSLLTTTQKKYLLKARKELAQKHIYVNEVLTITKYRLFMQGKSFCREKKLHSIWTRSGKIFVKAQDTSPPTLVKNPNHLQSLCVA